LTVGTTFRLDAVRPTALDARLAALGGGTLTRAASITYLDCDRLVEDATHQLGLAGVRVTRCASVPGPASGHRPAIAFDLAPLDESLQAIDVVELKRIPLSDASAALMRHRFAWLSTSRAARDMCRRLLRDEDAVLAWRRIVWCSVPSLRVARKRFGLRPVVFDHAAIERRSPRWTYVSEGAVERWAFA
jgi:hypothetical protein